MPPRLYVRGRAAVGSRVVSGRNSRRCEPALCPWLACAMVVMLRGLARAVGGIVVCAAVGVVRLGCCVTEAHEDA